MMSFSNAWRETAARRNSVLCAGLDPPVAELGRGEKGLAAGADRRRWALEYLEAVAPNCAAIKPNVQYWKGPGDIEIVEEVCAAARDLGLLVIEDAKLADIGATNDAGFFYAARRADAVTFAPFAGNVPEAVEQAHGRGIGIIVLCLMSNPEYGREKSKLIAGGDDPQYRFIAAEAGAAGADAVVVGAPSPSNHITEEELATVRSTIGRDMVVLMPGVGAQGGEAGPVWRVFEEDQVIVNAGRALMFPDGSDSTPQQQAAAARKLNESLNRDRTRDGRGERRGRSR